MQNGNWVTINGVHVFISSTGKVEKGPKNLIGKTYDNALSSNVSGNSVPDPFKDTRASNTVNVGDYVTLQSARSDYKKFQKEAKEGKSSTEYRKKIFKEALEADNYRVDMEKSLKEATNSGNSVKVNSIKNELSGKGYTVTDSGSVLTPQMKTGVDKRNLIQSFKKELSKATTPEEKASVIKRANNQGLYHYTLDGVDYFSRSKPLVSTPSINITMRGVKLDLTLKSDRKMAKNLMSGLSEEGKRKFKAFCISKGLDPETLNPIQ